MSLDDLRPGQRRSRQAVLEALVRARGRFSVFEATAHARLARTLDALFEEGLIARTGGDYPWTHVEITAAGRALLDSP